MCTNRIFDATMRQIGLATPISFIGRDAMENLITANQGNKQLENLVRNYTEELFFEKMYVSPYSIQLEPIMSDDDNTDSDVTTQVINPPNYDSDNKNKDDFEDDLKTLSKSIFTIEGLSGSGKTTYLHWLKYSFAKNQYEWHICDLENYTSDIGLLGQSFSFGNLRQCVGWKFVNKMLYQINEVIKIKYVSNGVREDINIYHKRLKDITNKYNEIFPNEQYSIYDNGEISRFFDNLTKLAQNTALTEPYNKTSVTAFHEYLNDYFTEYQREPKKVVKLMIDILIRLFLCLYVIDGKKRIFAIDNIEFYIPAVDEHSKQVSDEHSPMQISDIQDICNTIQNSCSEMNDKFVNHPKYRNSVYYGIVIVKRNTSQIHFRKNTHQDDAKTYPEVDTTEWFNFKEILEKRINYFEIALKETMDKIATYKEFYNNIMSDTSVSNWGLRNLINRMYNYSYRRLIVNVIPAISMNVSDDQEYIHFNEVWNKVKDTTNNDLYKSVKHLCRKFVVRQLLNYIHDVGFFTRLQNPDISQVAPNDVDSYARKITTMLHCVNLEIKKIKSENVYTKSFISFTDLIKAILERPFASNFIPEKNIEYVAKLLFLMNDTRNNKTHWNSLVEIKFDSSVPYNEQNLIEIIKNQWKNRDRNLEDKDKYGVKITTSGSFYAKIVNDFEYFACCIAKPNLDALLTIPLNATEADKAKLRKPLEAKTRLSLFALSHLQPCGNSYICIQIIKAVREEAFKCIDTVMAQDKVFCAERGLNRDAGYRQLYTRRYSWVYKDKYDDDQFIHPLRILNQHILYLNCYRDYVNNFLDNKYFEHSYRSDIVRKLDHEIREYATRRAQLTNNNRAYFNNQIYAY